MIWRNDVYDRGTFYRSCAIMFVVMLMQKISGGSAYLLLLPAILFSVVHRNPEKQIFWILLTITLMMGNGYFMPKNAPFYIGNRLVLGVFGVVGLMQLGGQRTSKLLTPMLWLIAYLLYMFIPSQTGWSPIISNLKLILFLVIFIAYFGVANAVINDRKVDVRKLRGMLLAMASFFIIGSVLVLPFPGISQLSGEEYLRAVELGQDVTSLFKGMSMHSQALGPVVCMIFTILFADLIFNVRKWNRLYIVLLLICPFLIYKTSSRAGMVSFLMGIFFIGWCLMLEHRVGMRWRTQVLSKLWLIVILCLMAVLAVPSLRDGITRFALKYNRTAKAGDFTMEEAMASRQFKMDEQMENFRKSPAIGNGFQVTSNMQGFRATSMLSLLSAPVEKGVWVTAVLEEGGVCGLIIFSLFVVVCGLTLLRRRAYTALACFFVMVISNMAEMTMFSMSAMGGFIWALVFIGGAFDGVSHRDRVRRAQIMAMPAGAMPPPPPYLGGPRV